VLLAGAVPPRAQHASFGAGVYLFHQRPFGEEAAEPHTELYADFAKADAAGSRWRVHGELRVRDSDFGHSSQATSRFRTRGPYDLIPAGGDPAALTLRAGKIYRRWAGFGTDRSSTTSTTSTD
jgi:hypothetical protein